MNCRYCGIELKTYTRFQKHQVSCRSRLSDDQFPVDADRLEEIFGDIRNAVDHQGTKSEYVLRQRKYVEAWRRGDEKVIQAEMVAFGVELLATGLRPRLWPDPESGVALRQTDYGAKPHQPNLQ